MRKLEREEIINLLPHGWGLVNDKLVMELQFKTFMDCIKFVDELANLAEGLQHHPDIFISYKKLRLELFTHSVKGITEKDVELAREINKLLEKWKEKTT